MKGTERLPMSLAPLILTLLLSAIVAAFASSALNTRRERLLSKQRKAEELFLAVESYNKTLSGIFTLYGGYLQGDITRAELEERLINTTPSASADLHTRMMMLTLFHFPQLEPAWKAYDTARVGVEKMVVRFERNLAGLQDFNAALDAYEGASEGFKLAIIGQGRKYAELAPFRHAARRWTRDLLDRSRRDRRT
jgi:hypothetical protein